MINLAKVRNHSNLIVKLAPLLAFAIPLVMLYLLNPWDPNLRVTAQDSFQLMWKGRTFQLFFIWLIGLEFILSWETIRPKIIKENTTKLFAIIIATLLPSLYILAENLGLNNAIAVSASQSGIAFAESMPLAVEYLVFSIFFCVTSFLFFGIKGLRRFALPALFLVIVGMLYTIDNLFPYGAFTPFQLLVPTTATLAAITLGWMGYGTLLGTENGMPTLQVSGPAGTAKFAIAWPCAGIESLLIFTAVAALFLQRMPMSWKAKIGYFTIGAIVTYFINILRIDTIFTIGMQYGTLSPQVQDFHFYYGPLYSIAWIVTFPLIIILSQALWHKLQTKNHGNTSIKPQQQQLNPV